MISAAERAGAMHHAPWHHHPLARPQLDGSPLGLADRLEVEQQQLSLDDVEELVFPVVLVPMELADREQSDVLAQLTARLAGRALLRPLLLLSGRQKRNA